MASTAAAAQAQPGEEPSLLACLLTTPTPSACGLWLTFGEVMTDGGGVCV